MRVSADPVRGSARAIHDGFTRYYRRFIEITRRARQNFEGRDWASVQHDARERLEVYGQCVQVAVERVCANLGRRDHDHDAWAEVKGEYASLIAGSHGDEIAETFFNSVTRRIFSTIGVSARTEFVDYTFERIPSSFRATPYRSYAKVGSMAALLQTMLNDSPFDVPYRALERDTGCAAERIARAWNAGSAPLAIESIEVLRPVFYRRKGAYLIGRVRGGTRVMPLVVCLTNSRRGIHVDAVLVDEDDVSVLFGFAHSYFHVDVTHPFDVVTFLRTLMPAKPVGEIYAALGFHKHGKTELYRGLRRHLSRSTERFDVAPGIPGMVMIVFTIPGFDVAFKVIRDTFPPQKQTTRARVRERYQLVFKHDRAGRLVDAQEFEHLEFARHRFSEALLQELLDHASKTVTLDGDTVTIKRLYTERRVRPLNLFINETDATSRSRVLRDYGQAVKDLAATGIFPGDLLLKNFGVTRQGRVIFYDYDEVCLLEDCTFRRIPTARYPEDELEAEPWYRVAPSDVFPEEFPHFVALPASDRAALEDWHGALFDPDYWIAIQRRQAGGEIIDIFPYPASCRLDAGAVG